MMPAITTTPETELTPELIDRVMKLAPESLGRLVALALERIDPPPENQEAVNQSWRDEIARRVASIDDGTAVYVDAKESAARLLNRIREKYGV